MKTEDVNIKPFQIGSCSSRPYLLRAKQLWIVRVWMRCSAANRRWEMRCRGERKEDERDSVISKNAFNFVVVLSLTANNGIHKIICTQVLESKRKWSVKAAPKTPKTNLKKLQPTPYSCELAFRSSLNSNFLHFFTFLAASSMLGTTHWILFTLNRSSTAQRTAKKPFSDSFSW